MNGRPKPTTDRPDPAICRPDPIASTMGIPVQLALMLGGFAAATLIARAFGAGWGTAATFGQLFFAAALIYVLARE